MSMQGWQALHSLSRDSSVKERRLASHRKARTRAKTGPPRLFWTTAVGAGGLFVTRWNTNSGHAFIDRLPR